MIVARGPAEILAFEIQIVGGNHNNATMFEQLVMLHGEKIMEVENRVFEVICRVAFETGTETVWQKNRRANMEVKE